MKKSLKRAALAIAALAGLWWWNTKDREDWPTHGDSLLASLTALAPMLALLAVAAFFAVGAVAIAWRTWPGLFTRRPSSMPARRV